MAKKKTTPSENDTPKPIDSEVTDRLVNEIEGLHARLDALHERVMAQAELIAALSKRLDTLF